VRKSAIGTTDIAALGFNPMQAKLSIPFISAIGTTDIKNRVLITTVCIISVIAMRFNALSLLYIRLKPDAIK
jgi:hypothetical protein